ncbi:MAG: hypothetical protein JNK78_04680 [Planctomycetes bacterium]|nr:hypothetical protein [Planctomycetota bacterium]
MRILPILFAAATLAASAVAQTPKINDAILKKDGSRVRGLEITEFLLTGVRGKRGADPFEVPAHLVAAIEWSNLPDAFISGRASMERGDFRTATQMFGEAINQTERPLVKADAEFFLIKSAVSAIGADKGAAATAAARAKSWIAANANHWRTPEALFLAGRAERLAGTGGAAATTLRELDDRALREGFGAIWSARAKSELALTLLADGKTSEARSAFQAASSAVDSALTTPSPDDAELKVLKTQARVGEGETFLGEKEFAKAESFFRGLTTGNEPALVAAGHAGEGQAIFLAAGPNGSPNDIRRAQVCFAKASVTDIASGEASAKANYYLGRCLTALGAEREGDTWKERATAYFQIVVTSYPSSPWATEARLELAK